MSNNYKDADFIHDYLEGNMDRNTLTKFEEELAKDAELAQEVQWHKDFRDAMLPQQFVHFCIVKLVLSSPDRNSMKKPCLR